MNTSEKTLTRFSAVLRSRISIAVGAIMLALVAIFPLSAWAEAVEWHHALQHVFIFAAGMVLGSSLFIKKQDEEE